MHDLIIREVTLYDGTGAPPATADVAVDGDRIAAVGAVAGAARATLDGRGLALAPGFIDVHTHDDQIVLAKPSMLPKISQGVTSVVVGNCGISLAPLVCRLEELVLYELPPVAIAVLLAILVLFVLWLWARRRNVSTA